MLLQLTDLFNHIFAALLSAFRKGYSCQSTLLNMIETLDVHLTEEIYCLYQYGYQEGFWLSVTCLTA